MIYYERFRFFSRYTLKHSQFFFRRPWMGCCPNESRLDNTGLFWFLHMLLVTQNNKAIGLMTAAYFQFGTFEGDMLNVSRVEIRTFPIPLSVSVLHQRIIFATECRILGSRLLGIGLMTDVLKNELDPTQIFGKSAKPVVTIVIVMMF